MARQIVRTKIRLYDRNALGMKILAYPAGSEVLLAEYERLRALSFNGAAVAPVAPATVVAVVVADVPADDAPPAIVAPETAVTEPEADTTPEGPAPRSTKTRAKPKGRRARGRKARRHAPAPVVETVAEPGDPKPDPEPLAYDAMLRAQLLVEAKSRGLSVGPRTSKNELVELLRKADR